MSSQALSVDGVYVTHVHSNIVLVANIIVQNNTTENRKIWLVKCVLPNEFARYVQRGCQTRKVNRKNKKYKNRKTKNF